MSLKLSNYQHFYQKSEQESNLSTRLEILLRPEAPIDTQQTPVFENYEKTKYSILNFLKVV